jgi:hypothetical protein
MNPADKDSSPTGTKPVEIRKARAPRILLDRLPEGIQHKLVSFNGHKVVGDYTRIEDTIYKLEKSLKYLQLSNATGDRCVKVKCDDKTHSFTPHSSRLVTELVQDAPAEALASETGINE